MYQFFSQYRQIVILLRKHWELYGGWQAFLHSPYLHISLFLAVCTSNHWHIAQTRWHDAVLAIFPSLLGFTFAGFSILLAFSKEIRIFLCGKFDDGKPSPFMNNAITIVHFMLMQAMVLLAALLVKPFASGLLLCTFAGVWLMYYAFLTAIGAVLSLFRIAGYIDMIASNSVEDE